MAKRSQLFLLDMKQAFDAIGSSLFNEARCAVIGVVLCEEQNDVIVVIISTSPEGRHRRRRRLVTPKPHAGPLRFMASHTHIIIGELASHDSFNFPWLQIHIRPSSRIVIGRKGPPQIHGEIRDSEDLHAQ